MTYRNVLLSLHVLFAVVLIGPLAASALFASSIPRLGADALPLARWTLRVDELLGRLSGLVAVTGILLVLREDAYSFTQPWIAGSLALFVAAAVNGAVGMGGAMRSAIARLERGESAAAEVGRLRLLGVVAIAIVVAVVWLMVAKPGL